MTTVAEAACELFVETDLGTFTAGYSETGLCSLKFPKDSPRLDSKHGPVTPQIELWHQWTRLGLHSILRGQVPRQMPPFDISRGTEFQQRVWRELQQIKLGETRSYAAIAEAIGSIKAVRAVGGA